MMAHHCDVLRKGTAAWAVPLALIGLAFVTTPAARAQSLEKLDASLKMIPENAAFYSTMLRNKEQIEELQPKVVCPTCGKVHEYKYDRGLKTSEAS